MPKGWKAAGHQWPGRDTAGVSTTAALLMAGWSGPDVMSAGAGWQPDTHMVQPALSLSSRVSQKYLIYYIFPLLTPI